jgi:hypothetical protein
MFSTRIFFTALETLTSFASAGFTLTNDPSGAQGCYLTVSNDFCNCVSTGNGIQLTTVSCSSSKSPKMYQNKNKIFAIKSRNWRWITLLSPFCQGTVTVDFLTASPGNIDLGYDGMDCAESCTIPRFWVGDLLYYVKLKGFDRVGCKIFLVVASSRF